jgi:RNA polymerase nonessential primary-like sigma factor
MRQAIERTIWEAKLTHHVPVHQIERVSQIKVASKRLFISLQRPATMAELANATGFPIELVKELLALDQRAWYAHSLDMPLGEESGETTADLLPDVQAESDDEITHRLSVTEAAHLLLASLSPRERQVIVWRFGFGCEEQSLQTIANRLQISRERVRQIEEQGLKKIRKLVSELGQKVAVL